MSTTTFADIRTQMLAVLEARAPTTNGVAVPFRRHRDEVPFFDWCAANKAACFRRFDIEGGFDFEGPEVSNTDVEFERCTAQVTLAYPLGDWGKYGAAGRASLDKVVEEDLHTVDDTLGHRGQLNWLAGSWWVKRGPADVADEDGVRYVKLNFEVGMYRLC